MAERRMFAKTIIDSDAFLDMPLSAQALYFHLSMRADDDGFVNNPKKIQRMVGASDDDCKLLILKRFILTFESGVIVIKHWKIHNYIQKDRYKETVYLKEKSELTIDENNSYTERIQNVYKLDTQVSIGKDRVSIDKDSIDKKENIKEKVDKNCEKEKPLDTQTATHTQKHKYGTYNNVLLTNEELEKILAMQDGKEAIEYLSEYIEMKGYKARSHYLCILKWVFNALKEQKQRNQRNQTIQRNDNENKPLSEFDEWLKNNGGTVL